MQMTDQMLRDYLDDALSAEARDAFEAALETDEALQDRLLAMELEEAGPLRAAWADVPSQDRLAAITAALPNAEAAPARRPALAFAGVAAAAAVVGFFLGASPFAGPDADKWVQQAAIYQALYVPETVAPISLSAEDLDAQLTRASEALGRNFPRSDLEGLPGLTFKRAQILGFEGAPLIQLVFATADGTPVAFCVVAQDGTVQGVASVRIEDQPVRHWSDETHGFMIVGRVSDEDMDAYAQALTQTF